DCGLSDGSSTGDWRVPNVLELQSLVRHGVYDPALPNTAGTGQWSEGDPFTWVQSNAYWTTTSLAQNPSVAWYVGFWHGREYWEPKTGTIRVWPVRGGQ
ncbi:DUF1566 domain-containing protein, partial [Chloroflexota bacterium]